MFRVLRERGLAFDIVAGHSLGEWSALVAAGALSLRDAVKLTHLRGTFMQEAVPVGQGAMAALMGLDLEKAPGRVREGARSRGEPVEPANLNGGGQIVISGHTSAVDRAIPEAKAAGAKIAKKLAVSAPFHCSMMKPAAEKLAAAIADVVDHGAERSGRRERRRRSRPGSGAHQGAADPAGHRAGALGRVDPGRREARRHQGVRARLGRGAQGPRQADRRDDRGHDDRRAARSRGVHEP